MLTWVAVSRKIHNDDKIGRIAEATRMDVDTVVGKLVRVFAAMMTEAPTGDLSRVSDVSIEEWAKWNRKRGVFATVFRAELCDAAGIVKTWEAWNGAAIRKALKDAKDKREWRANGAETARAENARGAGNMDGRTVDRVLLPFSPDDLPPVLKSAVPDREKRFLCDILSRVPYREAWLYAFEGALQGIHYKPISGAQLAQACREFLGNSKALETPNMRWWEQHVRTIATGEKPKSKRGRGGAATRVSDSFEAIKAFAEKGAASGE